MDLQPTMIRDAWRAAPLCRRYRHVSFLTVRLRTIDGGAAGTAQVTVHWAIAESRDAQLELLGPWEASPEAGWDDLFRDLATRGVVALGQVVGADGEAALKALRMHFPAAKVQGILSGCRRSSSFGPLRIPRRLAGRATFPSGIQAALAEVDSVLRRADRRLAGEARGSRVDGR